LAGRDYIPRLFQDDYERAEKWFRRGAFAQEMGALRTIACAGGLSGPFVGGLTGVSPASAACSPWLRRKSGLCYTADANSPFEAYIYVR
jgi:hypothetical protein